MSELPEIEHFIADVERRLREVAEQPEPKPDAARLNELPTEVRDAIRAAAKDARAERKKEKAAARVLANRTKKVAPDMVSDLSELARVARRGLS